MDEDPGSLKKNMEVDRNDKLGRCENSISDTMLGRCKTCIGLLWNSLLREILENKETIKKIIIIT